MQRLERDLPLPLPNERKHLEEKSLVKTEQQRRRHVELVRQSRLRKKSQRTYLQQLKATLERELHQGLTTHHVLYETLYDQNSVWDIQYKKFVDSIYEIRHLRSEQLALKEKLIMYEAMQERLELVHNDLKVAECFEPIVFNPLTPAQVQIIILELKTQALSFFQHMKRSSDTHQDQSHGWSHHQIVVSERVQFYFTKHISGISATHLVDMTWKMHCDVDLYRGIYTSVQRLEVLQMIDEDTLLLRRDLQTSESSPIFRTILLISRIRLDNGYVVCFRSYNPNQPIEDPKVQWMDLCYSMMVLTNQDVEPLGCDVSFGGTLLNTNSIQHASRWKYEIAIAFLRWESNVIAPLFNVSG